jgi:hypothetical protein
MLTCKLDVNEKIDFNRDRPTFKVYFLTVISAVFVAWFVRLTVDSRYCFEDFLLRF